MTPAERREAIARARLLAERVSGGDYHAVDGDGRASRITVDWPWSLASATLTSLHDADESGLCHLEALCERVERSDWATCWDDPGVYPSNAGAGPLPTRYDAAPEVHELAAAVREAVEATRAISPESLLP